jgi:hypothetical protein
MAVLFHYSNPKLLKLPDCGGLLENGKCSWLNIPECTDFKCSYYRKIDNLEKAQERLRSLNEETQARIAQKYYSGTRPWMDTDAKCRR